MAFGAAQAYGKCSSTEELSRVNLVCGGTAKHAWMHTLAHLLKNPLSSSSLSPPEHQSAPLYGCLLSATHILFTLLLSAQTHNYQHTWIYLYDEGLQTIFMRCPTVAFSGNAVLHTQEKLNIYIYRQTYR